VNKFEIEWIDVERLRTQASAALNFASSKLGRTLLFALITIALFFLLAGMLAMPALAQTVSPITVTPESLRPQSDPGKSQITIPESNGLIPPKGAESLSVTLQAATLEGGFSTMAVHSDPILARLNGQKLTLTQIYVAASEIEAAYARAGHVLARVAVPPQELKDGGTLRLLLINGFIEEIDVSAVPSHVRKAVHARTSRLKGQHSLVLQEIEQPLLIANDIPGLTLRSTLERGNQSGATRIVLQGSHRLISGSVGVDNQFDPSLGRWGANAQLALNSVLGLGEEVYGFVSTGYNITRLFSHDARVRVLGGGIALPVSNGRLTFNPEVTFARTAPVAALGAPNSVGKMRRLTFRTNLVLKRTRRHAFNLDGAIEHITASNSFPDFAFTLSQDRYSVARLGLNFAQGRGPGPIFSLSAQLSQGLGNLAAISASDTLTSGIGYSRFGAENRFTKLSLQARSGLALGDQFELSLSAKAQSTFGKAVFRPEQFSLEGRDALSAYVGGETAVDEGALVRAELALQLENEKSKILSSAQPYVFAAGGIGRINRPTFIEPSHLSAAALGAGTRFSLAGGKMSFAVEYARGFSDLASLRSTDRVNCSAVFRF
jgi:hemolysin activation/secretion protein